MKKVTKGGGRVWDMRTTHRQGCTWAGESNGVTAAQTPWGERFGVKCMVGSYSDRQAAR